MKQLLHKLLFQHKKNDASPPPAHHKTNAVKWVGMAWSYKALCRQCYEFGMLKFDSLKATEAEKPLAIIMDVDETILSNHHYEYERVKTFTRYSDQNWNEWVERANAPLIEGASAFIEHVRQAGVHVILISNRTTHHVASTLNNLSELGLRFTAEDMLFRDETRDKTARQMHIEQQYEVIMYVGDQQGDFREGIATLVLPNPMYGEWDQLQLPPM